MGSKEVLECVVECETTAIGVTQIVANRLFGQNWLLPLAMDKEHLRDIQLLKKAKLNPRSEEEKSQEENEIDAAAESLITDVSNMESTGILVTGTESEIQIQSQLATIEDGELVEVNVDIASIENRIAERKKQDAFRLPSMTAV